MFEYQSVFCEHSIGGQDNSMSKFSSEGWEIFSVTNGDRGNGHRIGVTFWMRRPKQADKHRRK